MASPEGKIEKTWRASCPVVATLSHLCPLTSCDIIWTPHVGSLLLAASTILHPFCNKTNLCSGFWTSDQVFQYFRVLWMRVVNLDLKKSATWEIPHKNTLTGEGFLISQVTFSFFPIFILMVFNFHIVSL